MRSSRKRSGSFLADKVEKNKMADADIAAELQGLQAGEEGRGSNASQTVDCCLEKLLEQSFAMGTNKAGADVRKERGEEKEQSKASQQLVLPTLGGYNDPSSFADLILLGFGVHMVKAEEHQASVKQMIEKELCPIHRVENDFRWRRMRACELDEWDLVERAFLARRRKEKQPVNGPKNV